MTLQMALKLQQRNIHVVPGWKFCRNCHQKFVDSEAGSGDSGDDRMDHKDNEDPSYVHVMNHEKVDKLNESLGIIGISPHKTHSLAKVTKVKSAWERKKLRETERHGGRNI